MPRMEEGTFLEAYFEEVAFLAVERAVVYVLLYIGRRGLGMMAAYGADLGVAGPASVLFDMVAGTARKAVGSVGVGTAILCIVNR